MATKTPAAPAPAPYTGVDTSAWKSAGRNLKYTTLDGMLFIAVPITNDVINASPVSASGKSKSVGSTLGNVGIDGFPIKFGVNVYSPV